MSATDTRPTDEEIRARRERSRTWYGYLADDTVDHIAERIRNLLTGRRYTFMALNTEQVTFSMPEVRTGQRLTPEKFKTGVEAVRVHKIGNPLDWEPGKAWESCGLSVADTYGSWGLHSSHATEEEARDDAVDPAKRHRTTYVHIEGGRTDDPRDVGRRDRIEVRHFNYMNPPQMLVWVIAVEPSREDVE